MVQTKTDVTKDSYSYHFPTLCALWMAQNTRVNPSASWYSLEEVVSYNLLLFMTVK